MFLLTTFLPFKYSFSLPNDYFSKTSKTEHTHYLSKDYSEEFRDIIGVKIKKNAISENGITLVNQHKYNEELPVNSILLFPLPEFLWPTPLTFLSPLSFCVDFSCPNLSTCSDSPIAVFLESKKMAVYF